MSFKNSIHAEKKCYSLVLIADVHVWLYIKHLNDSFLRVIIPPLLADCHTMISPETLERLDWLTFAPTDV